MKTIKMFVARYICNYYDGMALSSNEVYNKDKNQLIKDLRKEGYSKREIGIDTDKRMIGWEIVEIEIEV